MVRSHSENGLFNSGIETNSERVHFNSVNGSFNRGIASFPFRGMVAPQFYKMSPWSILE